MKRGSKKNIKKTTISSGKIYEKKKPQRNESMADTC